MSPSGEPRRAAILAVACAAVFVIVMDGSIVNVALPTLHRELGWATTSQLQWIVDAYILAFAQLLLAAGSFGDRFGRRKALGWGLVLFGAFSVGAACAETPGQLIAWRAAMGVGAALIFPTTLAIIASTFRETDARAKAIAAWAGMSGLGVALGPVVGGLLLEHFPWGSIFLVNIPILALAFAGMAWAVPDSRDPHPKRFDPAGNLLSIAGVGLLVWAVIEGPDHGWASARSLLALAGALLLLALFVAWELRCPHPMLDVRLFRRRRFAAGSLAITFAFFGLFGFVFMVTQYFQFGRGLGALGAGVRTLPFAAAIGLGAALAARHGGRLGQRIVVSSGLALMAVGFAWTTRDAIDSPYALLVAQMGVLGIGLGLVNAAATEAIMSSLPVEQAGVGSAVNDTTREVGGTLGVAVMGSLFSSVFSDRLDAVLQRVTLPPEAVSVAESSVGAALEVARLTTLIMGPVAGSTFREGVLSAFMAGFHASSWVAAGVAGAGAIVAALVLPRRRDAAVASTSEREIELDAIT